MNQSDITKRIDKSYVYFQKELGKVRGNRPNPELVENIEVEVYGTKMPIKQLATVTVVDPTLITVMCWDRNNAESVRKSIETSDMNVNPSVDGAMVRVPLPSLSQERREELVKIVRKIAEDAKITIRAVRRDLIDEFEKEDQLSEDDLERGKKEIQKQVDEYNGLIEKELDEKEKELLSI